MSARRNLTAARLREVPTDAHEHTHQTICAWCLRRFAPRRTGGRPQRFCSERCRRGSEKAMREWAKGELAAGRATIAEIKRERSSAPAAVLPRPDGKRPLGAPRALSEGPSPVPAVASRLKHRPSASAV